MPRACVTRQALPAVWHPRQALSAHWHLQAQLPGSPASTASGDILCGSCMTVNDVRAACEQVWGELLRESGHPVTSLQMRLKSKDAKLNFAKGLKRQLLAAYPDLPTRKELKIPKALSHYFFTLTAYADLFQFC